jgi:hypothetical protein
MFYGINFHEKKKNIQYNNNHSDKTKESKWNSRKLVR